MTRASLQALRRTITVEWPKATEEAARALLLKVATEGNTRTLDEQTQRSGITPSVEAYANTPGNKNLASVKLPGPIVYRYQYLGEIVQVALKALEDASPARSGRYKSSHTVFLNGIQMRSLPPTLLASDEIIISNIVPYARRLEIGKTKAGRDFVIQVPNRIYERVAKSALIPKYRNVAKIAFNYVSLPNAYVTKGGLSPSYLVEARRVGMGPHPGIARKRRQKPGEAIRYPGLIITALR
jgi:hypothetical protein